MILNLIEMINAKSSEERACKCSVNGSYETCYKDLALYKINIERLHCKIARPVNVHRKGENLWSAL